MSSENKKQNGGFEKKLRLRNHEKISQKKKEKDNAKLKELQERENQMNYYKQEYEQEEKDIKKAIKSLEKYLPVNS